MNPCKYATAVGCTSCSYVNYKTCRNFCLAHMAYLTRHIRPFKKTTPNLTSRIVWSQNIDLAKSAAAEYALKRNCEIRKLSLNQALSAVLDGSISEVEGKVFYIECSSKPFGDVEKMCSCLRSFVDKKEMDGCYISLFLSPVSGFRFTDIPKLC